MGTSASLFVAFVVAVLSATACVNASSSPRDERAQSEPGEVWQDTATVPAQLAAFCTGPQEAARAWPYPGINEDPPRQVGSVSGNFDPKLRCALRAQADWDALRALIRLDPKIPSEWNFDEGILLFASRGPTTGHAIGVGAVEMFADSVVAHVIDEQFSGCDVAAAVDNPYVFVPIRAKPRTVKFREHVRVTPC
jgi:hypothetical protein